VHGREDLDGALSASRYSSISYLLVFLPLLFLTRAADEALSHRFVHTLLGGGRSVIGHVVTLIIGARPTGQRDKSQQFGPILVLSGGMFSTAALLAGLMAQGPQQPVSDTGAVRMAAEQPAPPRGKPALRVHTGMWTMHFRDMQRGVEANHLLGVTWRGFYAVTFTNSFDKRAYSGGIEQTPFSRDAGPLTLNLGYRAGLVSGYDERFHKLAGRSPVIPVVQLRAGVDAGPGGVELSWAGVVTSVSCNFRM
jgi:hypothetical protein